MALTGPSQNVFLTRPVSLQGRTGLIRPRLLSTSRLARTDRSRRRLHAGRFKRQPQLSRPNCTRYSARLAPSKRLQQLVQGHTTGQFSHRPATSSSKTFAAQTIHPVVKRLQQVGRFFSTLRQGQVGAPGVLMIFPWQRASEATRVDSNTVSPGSNGQVQLSAGNQRINFNRTEIKIGREGSNDVRVSDSHVSRNHLTIVPTQRTIMGQPIYRIVDYSSTGTFIVRANETIKMKRVGAKKDDEETLATIPVDLQAGDIIVLGGYVPLLFYPGKFLTEFPQELPTSGIQRLWSQTRKPYREEIIKMGQTMANQRGLDLFTDNEQTNKKQKLSRAKQFNEVVQSIRSAQTRDDLIAAVQALHQHAGSSWTIRNNIPSQQQIENMIENVSQGYVIKFPFAFKEIGEAIIRIGVERAQVYGQIPFSKDLSSSSHGVQRPAVRTPVALVSPPKIKSFSEQLTDAGTRNEIVSKALAVMQTGGRDVELARAILALVQNVEAVNQPFDPRLWDALRRASQPMARNIAIVLMRNIETSFRRYDGYAYSQCTQDPEFTGDRDLFLSFLKMRNAYYESLQSRQQQGGARGEAQQVVDLSSSDSRPSIHSKPQTPSYNLRNIFRPNPFVRVHERNWTEAQEHKVTDRFKNKLDQANSPEEVLALCQQILDNSMSPLPTLKSQAQLIVNNIHALQNGQNSLADENFWVNALGFASMPSDIKQRVTVILNQDARRSVLIAGLWSQVQGGLKQYRGNLASEHDYLRWYLERYKSQIHRSAMVNTDDAPFAKEVLFGETTATQITNDQQALAFFALAAVAASNLTSKVMQWVYLSQDYKQWVYRELLKIYSQEDHPDIEGFNTNGFARNNLEKAASFLLPR